MIHDGTSLGLVRIVITILRPYADGLPGRCGSIVATGNVSGLLAEV